MAIITVPVSMRDCITSTFGKISVVTQILPAPNPQLRWLLPYSIWLAVLVGTRAFMSSTAGDVLILMRVSFTATLVIVVASVLFTIFGMPEAD